MSFLCADWFTTAYTRNTPLALALLALDLFLVRVDSVMIDLGLAILEVFIVSQEREITCTYWFGMPPRGEYYYRCILPMRWVYNPHPHHLLMPKNLYKTFELKGEAFTVMYTYLTILVLHQQHLIFSGTVLLISALFTAHTHSTPNVF